jgi:hypothetical protein
MKFDFESHQGVEDTKLDFQGNRVNLLYINGDMVEPHYQK